MRAPFCKMMLVLLFSSLVYDASSQIRTQRITGTVLDKVSKQPLTGANVFIKLEDEAATIFGTVSDMDGRFTLDKVPVGRHYLHCSYVSYESWISPYLDLTSAKGLHAEVIAFGCRN